MEKIPTAEEFLKGKSNSFDSQMRRDTFYADTVEQLCIEFAKLHVEAALEAAANKQEQKTDSDWEYKEVKESILNAYSLSNIK